MLICANCGGPVASANKPHTKEDCEGYYIPHDLYWQIKAQLRGMQIKQREIQRLNTSVNWKTALDDSIERLNELERKKVGE